MSLVINIEEETFESISWKNICCDIDGVCIKEYYSYEISVSDSTIQAEVEQDLTNKGYTW